MKTIESFSGTHIQYDSVGDAYFKFLSLKKYLEKIATHFIDIIEELESTRCTLKIKLIVGFFFEYDGFDKKVE